MEKMNPKSAARLLAVQSYYSMLMDKKQTKENAINTALEILKSEDLKVKKIFR
jgi:transcription termination factor NusB